ncbi:hypothetical protein IC582_026891 [Cucumis melo]|uniref:Uncharacterized protein LOC103497934 isoform X1 n=2 Tax=Cucumis melo TaxID=3656 RepID=A0A1S4E2T6_CUCME|nr:uncharacterized protein LOC103497934 isoform X1 [Cucumis melo]XP_016902295.1 uncharacterized protein LOC103497934 isoform X1 [Cucumis melo]XP_050947779.1 uncharacterized protein LOC103497934 isoform X1 [Cucumis melo]
MVSGVAVVLLIGFLGMFYQAKQLPPPSQINGSSSSSNNLPVSSQRIKLTDGRYLAYTERGVSKDKANFKIIVSHGFGSSKDMTILASQELIFELGIYFLLYDRPGYGESDPNPNSSVKSEAYDIQELADQLQIGSRFYLIGVSMGSYSAWSCLKYIPERLAGTALIVPLVNYQWPSLPFSLIKEDYRRKLLKLGLWLSTYTPGLLHWWVSQNWIPSTSVLEKNPVFFNERDIDILKTIPGFPMLSKRMLKEQRVFDTLRSDFMMAFGKWEFDPLELSNPYGGNESSVHIWQGCEDKVVPVELQRYVSRQLPWIEYHEVIDGGHLIIHYEGLFDTILRSLLLGEEAVSYRPKPFTPKFMS